MAMTVDSLCEEIMSDWSIPLSERVRIVRELRSRTKRGASIKEAVKSLAGIYMGAKWAKSKGASGAVGGYLGYLLSRRL